jgi:hypothetical protein
LHLHNKQSECYDSEFYDKVEAKRRFEAAVRGARIAGHKPMTDLPKKHEALRDKPGKKVGKHSGLFRPPVPARLSART